MSEPHHLDITDWSSEDDAQSGPDQNCNFSVVSRDVISSHPNVPDHVSDDEKDVNVLDFKKGDGVINLAFIPDDNRAVSNGINKGFPKEAAKDRKKEDIQLSLLGESKSGNFSGKETQSLALDEDEMWMDTDRSSFITKRIQDLVRAFSNRALKIKERIAQPPTPSPTPTIEDENRIRPRLSSLIQQEGDLDDVDSVHQNRTVNFGCCKIRKKFLPSFPRVLDPQSKLYITWLFFVMLSYVYNVWVIFLRAVFLYKSSVNPLFLAFDYISDLIYIIDIALFKVRLQFLHDGFWVDDPEKTRIHYFKKTMFKAKHMHAAFILHFYFCNMIFKTMDLLSLLPLDLLYFVYGTNNPLFRLPRFLKIQTFWEFFHRVDAVAKTPYVIRIIRTLLYMMYLIHLNACAYYAMSDMEGIGSNDWVLQDEGNAYIRCFYFATKTATSIGKNPKPQNEYEYVFMTISWLMGVFIFAFLIGQIRDIVATATQSKTQYRQLMDQTVMYMRNLNLPDDLQRRVRLWLNHTWEQQKTLNESSILDSLPRKMKTDVAINVHYNTLVKVQLFKDCDKALLRDLVLQLKPVLFLPGDHICRKGEVGKEMYIVNKGLVQVMGGEKGDLVLATLSEGSVFGEISLLGIPGCNRRTADVRSQGFSNLFVLSKDDLWDALKNYPEAQEVLRKKAKSLIKENEARDKASKDNNNTKVEAESIIKQNVQKPTTPQLLKTVIQVVPRNSMCAQLLTGRSSMNKKFDANFKAPGSPNEPSEENTFKAMPGTSSSNKTSTSSNRRSFPLQTGKNRALEFQQRSKSASAIMSPARSLINLFTVDKMKKGNNDNHALQLGDSMNTECSRKSGDETKDFIKSILDLLPNELQIKKQNIVHPANEAPVTSCNKPKQEPANCSEDSGISIDLKTHYLNQQALHPKTDDSLSTGDSEDSGELSAVNSKKITEENILSEETNVIKDDHYMGWASPTSSVFSLHSLFRTSSSRSSSTIAKDGPLSPVTQQDFVDPYRPASITSGSSSAGYDNLAFTPFDIFSSRRSSIFSDDTSC